MEWGWAVLILATCIIGYRLWLRSRPESDEAEKKLDEMRDEVARLKRDTPDTSG